tara:strand:- start:87 stop:1109 length:1023 start_codon:yes stop_codon:yes gene_type:complete
MTYFLLLFIIINNSYGQNCFYPDSLSTQDSISTLNYAFVSLRWNPVVNIDNYRVRFKKLNDTVYEYRYAYQDTNRTYGFDHNEYYVWNVKSWCDSLGQNQSLWSLSDTFLTTSFIPAPFDPIIGVSLSNNYCDSLSDISFNVTQVANEPDMSSISIISNEGFFIIDSLSIGDTVGYSNVVAGGGFINSDYTLIIDDIPSSYIAKVALNNDSTNLIDGIFFIENTLTGIKLIQQIPNVDFNNYTTGLNSVVVFEDIFLNPPPGITNINLFVSIISELNDTLQDNSSINIQCPGLAVNENNIYNNKIISVIDVFGREMKIQNNVLLFYIYDDGRVEKHVIFD